MVTFCKGLYQKLQAELHNINSRSESYLSKAEKAIIVLVEYLKELQQEESKYEFKDPEEQIQYYKEMKPLFLREKIFYLKQYEIESCRPIAEKETIQHYYRRYITEIENFFESHRFLLLYYQLEKIHLDAVFFIRNPPGLEMLPQYLLCHDPACTNIYSHLFGQFQAFADLNQYLYLSINGKEGEAFTPRDTALKTSLSWEGTKAQFYEMVYGLVSAGIIKTDVKTAMEMLAAFLGIKLGNYYGYFMAMRIRKKNRTPFFSLLKDFTERRMDESDEHPRFH